MQHLQSYSDSSNSDDDVKPSKKGKLRPSLSSKEETAESFSQHRKCTHTSKYRARSRSPVNTSKYDWESQRSKRATSNKEDRDHSKGLSKMPKAEPTLNQLKFPNPSAKFDLIKEKRKKLWSSKKEIKAPSTNQWELATFSEGDEAQAKFRRLMGMGSSPKSVNFKEAERKEDSGTLKQLEQQYESSRYLTHVARGVGLGFATSTEQHEDETKK